MAAVHDDRQRIDLVAVDQRVHAHERAGLEAHEVVVQRGVAAADRLELVEEVQHHLGHRQLVADLHLAGQVLDAQLHAALVLAQLDDRADVGLGGEDVGADDRLAHLGDLVHRRQLGRVVQRQHLAVGLQYLVDHRGRGRDQVEVVLALQALLHDLHVQHAQEAAAEAEAHGLGAFRLEAQRGVVEPQLLQRLAQVRVVLGVDREQAGEHARLHLLEARQRPGRRVAGQGQRVAHRRAVHVLDRGGDPAHLARAQGRQFLALGGEHADLVHLVGAAGRHHQDLALGLDLALHHAHQRDHAQVVVEPRVDDQRLQLVGVARHRRRDAVHDRLEHVAHVQAGLGADRDRVGGVDADHRLDLGLGAVDVGGGQVDLVEHGHHFQALLHRGVAVGHRLRLHALGRIHHQQRALAGGQRAADLVAEVDVARRVDEVQEVGLPVLGRVRQGDGLRLDGDPALALDRIVVEHLRFHLALAQPAAQLDDAVGERRLAVVDVGDDGEVADLPHGIGHGEAAVASVRTAADYRIARRADRGPDRRPTRPPADAKARRMMAGPCRGRRARRPAGGCDGPSATVPG